MGSKRGHMCHCRKMRSSPLNCCQACETRLKRDGGSFHLPTFGHIPNQRRGFAYTGQKTWLSAVEGLGQWHAQSQVVSNNIQRVVSYNATNWFLTLNKYVGYVGEFAMFGYLLISSKYPRYSAFSCQMAGHCLVGGAHGNPSLSGTFSSIPQADYGFKPQWTLHPGTLYIVHPKKSPNICKENHLPSHQTSIFGGWKAVHFPGSISDSPWFYSRGGSSEFQDLWMGWQGRGSRAISMGLDISYWQLLAVPYFALRLPYFALRWAMITYTFA